MINDNSLRRYIKITFLLGLLSTIAVVVSVLALLDISQQEENLVLEWLVVVISTPIILGFHLMALFTITRLLSFLSQRTSVQFKQAEKRK